MSNRHALHASSSGLAAILLCAATPAAAQAGIGAGTVVEFASVAEGRALLGSVDDYVARMGSFDRMLRLKTAEPVTQQRFLEHAMDNVLPWNATEKRRLETLVADLAGRMQDLNPPLPPRVLLVKTTGREEEGVAHTRANAIMLSLESLAAPDAGLAALLAHEFFHLMTRHDPAFRARAYRSIGFRLCAEVALPEKLAALRITNPDAPLHDAYVEVMIDGGAAPVMPVLLSRAEKFDEAIGRDISDYWILRLMVLRRADQPGRMEALLREGEPVLLPVAEVSGFFEQTGRNTAYIIHPEEILADNFALMLSGKSVDSPEILTRLRQAFDAGRVSGRVAPWTLFRTACTPAPAPANAPAPWPPDCPAAGPQVRCGHARPCRSGRISFSSRFRRSLPRAQGWPDGNPGRARRRPLPPSPRQPVSSGRIPPNASPTAGGKSGRVENIRRR
jgi:hypothetical protein